MLNNQTILSENTSSLPFLSKTAFACYYVCTHWLTLTILVALTASGFALFEWINNSFGDYSKNKIYFTLAVIFLPMVLIRYQFQKLKIYLLYLGALMVIWFSPWSEIPEFGRNFERVKPGMSLDEAKRIVEYNGMILREENIRELGNTYVVMFNSTLHENADSIGRIYLDKNLVIKTEFIGLD